MAVMHVVLSGRVQGVGFRYFALRSAQRLNLHGWVRNLPDGSVEIEAEGTREALERFAEEMQRGPTAARVDDCRIAWGERESGRRGFRIIG